jgi:DNA-binding XRE family transcriptional regulator
MAVIIYALVDPRDGRVRYVGRSVNPAVRMIAHMNGLSTSRKGRWLRELVAEGLTPLMKVLDETDWEHQKSVEYEWIERYRQLEPDLTNAHDCPDQSWRGVNRDYSGPSDMTADELRSFRVARGLSQAKLARLLGTHFSTVSRWEKSTRGIPSYVRLALERIDDLGE